MQQIAAAIGAGIEEIRFPDLAGILGDAAALIVCARTGICFKGTLNGARAARWIETFPGGCTGAERCTAEAILLGSFGLSC
jgi:hypothetical protein